MTPSCNQAEIVDQFYETLKAILISQPDLDHRIVFVDDGRQGGTLEKLHPLAARDPTVHAYSLSRNFGQRSP